MNVNNKLLRIVCVVVMVFFIIIGVVFTLIASVFMVIFNEYDPKTMTEKSVGTIVDLKENTDTSYAIIEYIVEEDMIFTLKSHYASSSFFVGDEYDVYYNPQNPKEAAIKIADELKIIIMVFYGVGVFSSIAICISLFAFIRLGKAQKKEESSELSFFE